MLLRGFLAFLAALSLALPQTQELTQTGRRRPATPGSPQVPSPADFTAKQMEFYLSADTIAFIRPGLEIRVNSVEIPSDRRPVVDLTVTDNFNNRLDRDGLVTPGSISMNLILAWFDPDSGNYTAYTTRTQTAAPTSPNPGATAVQASSDSGGSWTQLELGHYMYRFRTALPAGFDAAKTHTLGIYASRNLQDEIGKTYYANVEHDFRPDGQPVTATWDRIREASSCLNCHEELAFHGGSRRDVKLCVLCHSPQTSDPDTGNSVDMGLMTHRIHMGSNLPSGNPYVVIGFRNSVHNYAGVVYPQDIRNCDNCHQGTDARNEPSQAHVWYTRPSRMACGSCHDNINWQTGEGHAAGPQLTDAQCGTCHQPEGPEFGASVQGAHVIPEKSSQLAGLNAEIVSTRNVAPGQKPTVVFKITNDDGTAVDGTALSTFAPILGGPTTDYRHVWRENGIDSGVYDAAAGTTTYTFTNAIPEDSGGTWVFSADLYRSSTIQRADGEPDITLREAAVNPIHYAATSGAVKPRRTSVVLENCNSCHDRLAFHGGQRLATDECVICHNPVTTDERRRPASELPPEGVSFEHLIHRIHAGEHLQNDFTVYGFGNRPHNYNHVLFPGDLRNCDKCHVNDSQQLPPPVGTLPVVTPRDFFSPKGPGTAACLGCHDTRDAAAHAFINTAFFPGTGPDQPAEACAACHGPNSDQSVNRVHAK